MLLPTVKVLVESLEVKLNCRFRHLKWRDHTPLSYATLRGRLDVVKLLLATRRVEVDPLCYAMPYPINEVECQSKMRSLSFAAESKSEDMVRLLLDYRAAVDGNPEWGLSSLLHASRAGNIAAAELLLDRGADIHWVDPNGRTALSHAIECGSKEIIEMLLDRDAKARPLTKHLINYNTDTNIQDNEG